IPKRNILLIIVVGMNLLCMKIGMELTDNDENGQMDQGDPVLIYCVLHKTFYNGKIYPKTLKEPLDSSKQRQNIHSKKKRCANLCTKMSCAYPKVQRVGM